MQVITGRLEVAKGVVESVHLRSFCTFSLDHTNSNKVLKTLLEERRLCNIQGSQIVGFQETDESNYLKQPKTSKPEIGGQCPKLHWIRCILHKFDLMETHMINELKKDRMVIGQCGIPPLVKVAKGVDINNFKLHGMKDSNGNFPYCATNFLYQVGLILFKITKGEKTNWGYQFHHWLTQKNISLHVNLIDGSQLHIYSHAALNIYITSLI